jgi:hypothetical protein
MQLTLAHMAASFSTVLAGWLMVRAGAGKKMLKIRSREQCAACGRRLERGRCPCIRS